MLNTLAENSKTYTLSLSKLEIVCKAVTLDKPKNLALPSGLLIGTHFLRLWGVNLLKYVVSNSCLVGECAAVFLRKECHMNY